MAVGAVAGAGLLWAGKPTAAAWAAGLAAWLALVARLTPRWRARAVKRTGDGVEIHVRRVDRLLGVALGFAPIVVGAVAMASDIGWEAVAAALGALAAAGILTGFFGGERRRVGIGGVERLSWSGRSTSLTWGALERFEREPPLGEEPAGGGFLLGGPGTAGGRAQPVRIRIPDSQAGLGEFAGIALAHAPGRLLDSQPALRQALEDLVRGSAAEAPRMVRS